MKQLLSELFDTYYKDIYTYLYSLCRDPSLSEDLTSDVFVEVVRSITSFRGESDIKTWLFTIARRKWFTYLKKQNKTPCFLSLDELYDGSMTYTADMEADGTFQLLVNQILAKESAMTKNVFQLRVEGYSYYEIGTQLGISENSARVIFFRLKAKIKKQMEKEGMSYA